jgi:uncharacterized repeat protein (TIGR01451 family)
MLHRLLKDINYAFINKGQINMRKPFRFLLTILMTTVLIFSLPQAVNAATTPVTVTIWKLVQIDDPDSGKLFSVAGDFYAKVKIDGFDFQTSSEVSIDPGFGEGVIYSIPITFEPFWTFTRDVELTNGTADIEIQIWDGDDPGFPLFDDDDQVDVGPAGGDRTLNLTLDLATGNWSGEIPLNQAFVQGEGDGDRSKIFFTIGTQSASGDADGDGLLDGWESRGLDVDGDGTIDINLPVMGANPIHKDLFLELDYMSGQTTTRANLQAMKTAFAAAPLNAGGINNPDGQPGINLWVDTGNLVDTSARETGAGPNSCNDGIDNDGDGLVDGADSDCLVGDNFGGGNQISATPQICDLDTNFYNAKRANFNANRALVFRYGINAQGCDQDSDGSIDSGGWGELGGNDFIEYNHDGGTIMHELGHNLNLDHGGNVPDNCKPNYVSVMNYDRQFGISQAGGGSILDYSPPRFAAGRGTAPLGTLTENNLDEATILDATDATNRFVYVNGNGQKVQSQLNQPVDWNGDGDTNDSGLTVNIDTSGSNGNPRACTNTSTSSTLTGFDDWSVIAMSFRQFGDSADGAINPVTEPELTLQELLDLQQQINTTDVAIVISDSPDPATAGGSLTYTLTVTNMGPNPASQVQVVDILPAGVSHVSNSGGCVEAPAGTLTCDLGEMLARSSQAITVQVLIDSSLVHNAGGPTTITNSATVTNLAGPDPSTGNNSASEATQVIALADVSITKSAATDPVIAGTDETYLLTVTNNGPSDAENVSLTDVTPTNTIFISRSQTAGPGFACTDPTSGTTGTVACNLTVLPAGASATFTLVLHVLSSAPDGSTITNTAAITSTTDDPNLANNSGTVTVNVITRADLSVTKSQERDLVIADISQTYHITLVNNGPSDAQSVILSDPTPANTTFVSASQDTGPAFTCITPPVGTTGNFTCSITTLTAGSSASFTMVVSISPVDTDAITNMASATSTTIDPDPSNNKASVTARDSIKEWKNRVLTELVVLRDNITDRQVGRKINQAIKNLSDSLDPSLWATDNTLDPRHGNKVFTREKNASLFITNLIRANNSGLSSVLAEQVEGLIAADHALADIALHQAIAAGGPPNLIGQAMNELARGDNDAQGGRSPVAIERYRNSWQHSQQALNRRNGLPKR